MGNHVHLGLAGHSAPVGGYCVGQDLEIVFVSRFDNRRQGGDVHAGIVWCYAIAPPIGKGLDQVRAIGDQALNSQARGIWRIDPLGGRRISPVGTVAPRGRNSGGKVDVRGFYGREPSPARRVGLRSRVEVIDRGDAR